MSCKNELYTNANECDHCKGNQFLHITECCWNAIRNDINIEIGIPEIVDPLRRIFLVQHEKLQNNSYTTEEDFVKITIKTLKGYFKARKKNGNYRKPGKKWLKRKIMCYWCNLTEDHHIRAKLVNADTETHQIDDLGNKS